MEYVALGDLSYFIKKRDTVGNNPATRDMMVKYPNPRVGGLNEVVVRHFLHQLASALSFLRSKNLIHRDVKPQNLLLNPSPLYYETDKPEMMPFVVDSSTQWPLRGIKSLPMLKLADFGFARSLPSTSLASTLCGSPLYMAPEILRYEKYAANADLWSVGTVLYEMVTGKPPFRASNHVELLRRIEKGEDRINFPEGLLVSEGMKDLIRSLLKISPDNRCTFPDFFSHEVILDPIPGLAPEDEPEKPAPTPSPIPDRRRGSLTDPGRRTRDRPYSESPDASQNYFRTPLSQSPRQAAATEDGGRTARRSLDHGFVEQKPFPDAPKSPKHGQRPPLSSHATAPAKADMMQQEAIKPTRRLSIRDNVPATPSLLRQEAVDNDQPGPRSKAEKDRQTAQDIAFERDYVVVEKRAVEVNALADELAASPKIQRNVRPQVTSQSGAMIRRATTSGVPLVSGAQVIAKGVQIASGQGRPEVQHQRQGSFERRYGPSPSSASSAISKALNMASGRLFGVGFSPPLPPGRGGRSPPGGYSPFPAYPVSQGSLVLVGDGPKGVTDEDTKLVQSIEECATRSDVVYGFAEIKYQQLIPSAPSARGLGLKQTTAPENSDNADGSGMIVLDMEARVTVSEEALVLYVKALSLLAKSMDIAGRWWTRKQRPDSPGEPSRSSPTTNATGVRVNNVVQWIRSRFNEVLEKAEVVRRTLGESQKSLPLDHPSHPDNQLRSTVSSRGLGTSVDHVVVSLGVTAEKIMFDRAVEMSRTSAINELTGEDLGACELNYITAIRLLEAVLEDDDDALSKKTSGSLDRRRKSTSQDEAAINGLEAEDRKTVLTSKVFAVMI